jgi:hypothetical protein
LEGLRCKAHNNLLKNLKTKKNRYSISVKFNGLLTLQPHKNKYEVCEKDPKVFIG